jgi:hypothetical protein
MKRNPTPEELKFVSKLEIYPVGKKLAIKVFEDNDVAYDYPYDKVCACNVKQIRKLRDLLTEWLQESE